MQPLRITPSSCLTPPSGLVSWWRAESNAFDQLGLNNGTLYNGASFATGKIGAALTLDGANDHLRIPDHPSLHFTNALTIEGWVYPTSANGSTRVIVSKWMAAGPNVRSYALALASDGRAYLNVSPNGTDSGAGVVYSTNSIPANHWTYLAGTYDGTALRIYVNGALQNAQAYTNGIFPGTGDLGIGANVAGLASVTRGDLLKVFNRALDGPPTRRPP